ncbi:MAG: tetratricopeptide repeat protein [Myxococcota bacterium]
MTSDREAMFLEMVREFPDSPMGHFSLGRLYLDEKRWADSVKALREAVRLDGTYAAAFVALGDAYAGLGDKAQAKAQWQKALSTPLGQRDMSLQADLEQRIRDIDDF